MIIVDKKIVANIPLLEVVQKELLDQAVPTVFFFHGFTSAKEHNLHYAYLMAEKIYGLSFLRLICTENEAESCRWRNKLYIFGK